jgi:hypothetical protein
MTYTWNIGGTTSTTTNNSKTSQTLNSTTTYTVRLTNSYGCVGAVSSPATITVIAVSQPPLTVTASAVCQGALSPVFSISPTQAGATYVWRATGETRRTGGTEYIFSKESMASSVTTKSVIVYAEIARGGQTCQSVESSKTLTINLTPAFTLVEGSQTVTPGMSVTTRYTITPSISTLNISGVPEGMAESHTTSAVTISGRPTYANTYTYVMTGASTQGCTYTKSGTLILPGYQSCENGTFTLGTVAFMGGAASTATITRNGYTMSDRITATNCAKATYSNSSDNGLKSDCRYRTDYNYYYYSFCMVSVYQFQICPSGWHIPTKDEAQIWLGGTTATFSSASDRNTRFPGWTQAGKYTYNNSAAEWNDYGYIYTITPGTSYTPMRAWYLQLDSNSIDLLDDGYIGQARQVRCIKRG